MSKTKKNKDKTYSSFEQWKSENFPEDSDKARQVFGQNIDEIAVYLANNSFNKVLSQTSNTQH